LRWTSTTAGTEIGYYDMENNKLEVLEYDTPGNELYPTISPDGRWIAYVSTHEISPAIYVAPFPGPGQPIKVVSLDKEFIRRLYFPLWAPDMTALYYLSSLPDYEVWKVKVQVSESFSIEEPQCIFNGGISFYINGLDIHPAGDRFLAVQRGDAEIKENNSLQINAVVNWDQELEDN